MRDSYIPDFVDIVTPTKVYLSTETGKDGEEVDAGTMILMPGEYQIIEYQPDDSAGPGWVTVLLPFSSNRASVFATAKWSDLVDAIFRNR